MKKDNISLKQSSQQNLVIINKKIQYYKDDFLEYSSQQQSSNRINSKQDYIQNLDLKRIEVLRPKQIKYQHEKAQKLKPIIKMNKFREDVRKNQRQLHQQNHQFIRISTVLSSSAYDQNKFKNLGIDQRRLAFNNNKFSKNQNVNEALPTVNVKLATEFSQTHLKEKFAIKQLYLRTPYKKESIQFNPNIYLHPNNEFFIFQFEKQSINQIRLQFNNLAQDMLASQFKQSIKKVTYYLNYFDYIYIINKPNVQSSQKIPYPKHVNTIASCIATGEVVSDNQEPFDNKPVHAPQIITDHRIVRCKSDDLGYYPQSMYFQTVQLYMQYKQLRESEFKTMKIYDKDIEINTDVRNIISSQKIYLIEIMKEIEILHKIAEQAKQYSVIKAIYKDLRAKADQYLKLVCGYTTSVISFKFNIENQHQKIYEFIEGCLKYGKDVRNVDKEVIIKFPVLQIWYSIPPKLFGYDRQVIHNTFYNLVVLTQKFLKKIEYYEKYQQLKIKKDYYKYK